MKYLLTLIMISNILFSKSLVDCNQIFEARKDEILRELDKLDEKQEEFELYKEAKLNIIKQKEKELQKREEAVQKSLQEAQKLKKEAQKLKKENEEILKNIKIAKEDKISKTYMKMRDSKAAAIFDTMKQKDAARILFGLKASKISKIMAKMDPQNAAVITKLIEENKAFSEK